MTLTTRGIDRSVRRLAPRPFRRLPGTRKGKVALNLRVGKRPVGKLANLVGGGGETRRDRTDAEHERGEQGEERQDSRQKVRR